MVAQIIQDGLRTIDQAADDLGISVTKLLSWMDNNGWLIVNDTSWDVMPEHVNVHGHLKIKNGVFVTPKGMQVLHEALVNPDTHYVECDGGEIPFEKRIGVVGTGLALPGSECFGNPGLGMARSGPEWSGPARTGTAR